MIDGDGAKCSGVPDPTCEDVLPVSNYECVNEGVFPDPQNCKKYYICTDNQEDGFLTDEYECDDNYVFDPSAPRDDYCRLTFNLFCVKIDCNGETKNIQMRYPFFPAIRGPIVASCRGSNPPLVYRCPANLVADLKTIPVECKPNCVGPLKYEYPNDNTKYFDCVFNGAAFVPRVKSCYRNYVYDARRRICVVNTS